MFWASKLSKQKSKCLQKSYYRTWNVLFQSDCLKSYPSNMTHLNLIWE